MAITTHEEIRREYPLAIEDASNILELATEASEVLGYKKLLKHLEGEFKLYNKLAALGIHILNTADVKEYQHQHRKEVAARMFAEWMNQDSRDSFYMPSWNEREIERYHEEIPEFVLNKAVQIKKELPEAQLFVEYLEESQDPFLVVKTQKEVDHGSWKSNEDIESYYIEVWNEPKFENRLR